MPGINISVRGRSVAGNKRLEGQKILVNRTEYEPAAWTLRLFGKYAAHARSVHQVCVRGRAEQD